LGAKELVDKNVSLLNIPEIKETDLMLAYKNVSTDDTVTYYVFVNADNQTRSLSIGDYDLRGAKMLIDNDEAGAKPVEERSGLKKDTLTIDPLTTLVIKVDKKGKARGKSGEKPGKRKGQE
jgi:pullulanase